MNELVWVRGMADTRAALGRWNERPGPVVLSWMLGGFGFAVALLAAVCAVAYIATPDPSPIYVPGISYPAGLSDVLTVLARNGLVLALHAVACVAGFTAGSSLPLQAETRTGFSRWIHDRARPVAFGWICLVTVFSLITQAYVLGSTGATLASHLHISPAVLVLTVAPHALLELTAVFLPLAAWTIASRRGDWQDLLAATFATVVLAVPMLVVAALWETYVWPHLLIAASPVPFLSILGLP